jgi:ribosomal protein S18 acetylase RimI-like enzyme
LRLLRESSTKAYPSRPTSHVARRFPHPLRPRRPRGILCDVIAAPTLVYRRIDPRADVALVARHYHDAHVATYGDAPSPGHRYRGDRDYLRCLAARVDEYPDGHVLALLDDGRVVGQLELQVPYGLETGYVSLYYVAPAFRGLGFGRRMHAEYAERYFRSWEARRVELDVSRVNTRAVRFYLSIGYRFETEQSPTALLRRMALVLG